MMKLLLQHAALLGATIVLGAVLSVSIVQSLSPAPHESFIIVSRNEGVAFVFACLSGGTYLVVASVRAWIWKRQRKAGAMSAATPVLVMTLAVVALLAAGAGVIAHSNYGRPFGMKKEPNKSPEPTA